MIIQGYKIAENEDVMTPVMINLDGFILTHTYEMVEIPDQDKVDQFLPDYKTVNKMSLDNPMNACMSAGNQWHMEFRMKQESGIKNALNVVETTDKEFADMFGRQYGGTVENYFCDDAEVVLTAIGSICGTIRVVVDEMRRDGFKVGMLKIRYMRPFPSEAVNRALKEAKAIGVIDKDLSFGYEGTVYTNLNSALYSTGAQKLSINYIAGIGGRDISKENIREMYLNLLKASTGESVDRIQYVNTRCDYE
jgi:pyruvate ferredoxin oxidoreductase alpha subunit